MKTSLKGAAGVAGALSLALLLAACGSDDPVGDSGAATGDQVAATQSQAAASDAGQEAADAALAGNLAGAGATSMESAQDAWRAGFQTANPDVTVSYDGVGSGGGRTQFLQGAVAFAGSDAALTDEEIASSKQVCEGSQAYDLPVYISPIAVIFNLSGVSELNLAPATIAGIFDGKITTWNDAAIAADNPDATLPDTAITPVNRSDDSGTTENFTEYLSATAPDAWTYEPSGTWPISGGQSAKGTSGLVETVKAADGAIGYADASKAGDLGKAKIKVGEAWVAVSAEGAAEVVDASPRAEGRAEHDIVVNLDRTTTQAGAYPLVLVSYGVVCGAYADAAQGELVKAYFTYLASADGQSQAADAAGSAPISADLTADVTAAIESISIG